MVSHCTWHWEDLLNTQCTACSKTSSARCINDVCAQKTCVRLLPHKLVFIKGKCVVRHIVHMHLTHTSERAYMVLAETAAGEMIRRLNKSWKTGNTVFRLFATIINTIRKEALVDRNVALNGEKERNYLFGCIPHVCPAVQYFFCLVFLSGCALFWFLFQKHIYKSNLKLFMSDEFHPLI